jgi:transcription elongation factor SPT5
MHEFFFLMCRTRHLQLAGGGKVTSGSGGGGGGTATAGGLPGFMSPRLSSPAHPTQGGGHRGGGGGGGGGGFRGGGRGRGRGGPNIGRDRELIGQTIKITQGPYKGHIGIVKVGCAACC